jgi:5,10-methylenetetrahydromethanopterin reductase
MIQLSIGISGSKSINDYIGLAKLAEAYHFHTLSIFDDLMFKPAWPILYVVAQQTERIRLGPSVTNPYLIHPAIWAENAAMLDEISTGRAYFGVGRGAFLDFVNVQSEKPIHAVRETIEIVRRLWRGDATPFQGQVFQTSEFAKLQWQPLRPNLLIMVGTWGERMCQMAGGVADEIKAGSMWSALYGNERVTHF